MTRILVIEDDPGIRANIVELLEAEDYSAIGVADGRAGIAEALARPPDLVLCDISMPGADGYEVLRALQEHASTRAVPFVFLTAKADREDVRHGMRLGADDYVTKPFSRTDLLGSIEGRLERARARESQPDGPTLTPSIAEVAPTPVVIVDERMRGLYEMARRAAQGPISVLVLGETGVGKDVLAREIHRASPRAAGPFVALNCAALSETLLESELFGHEKGAFTGAGPARAGLFESAHGGTIFLDEIGDVPLSTQVKLLRVLEERKVLRVGARTPIPVDVRFVSATNRDIEAEAAAGRFRSDLLFRLNGITIEVPPLRERPAEILPLAEVFLEATCRALQRATPRFSAEARDALTSHDWPGNVRELRHAVERSALMAGSDEIGLSHLPPKLSRAKRDDTSPSIASAASAGLREASRAALEDVERRRIEVVLVECGGNQTLAAARLGISRRTLVSRLSQYDFPRPRKK